MFTEEESHYLLLGEKSEFWKLSTDLKGEDSGEMTGEDQHCWSTITAPHLTELEPIMWICGTQLDLLPNSSSLILSKFHECKGASDPIS